MNDPDLSLVATPRLIEELLRRCDHGFVVLMRSLTDENQAYTRRWKGNTHTVCGLAADLSRSALIHLDEQSVRGRPEEF